MDPKELEAMLARLVEKMQPAPVAPEAVTKAEVDGMLDAKLATFAETFSTKVSDGIAEAVAKALPAPSREGVGRSGTVNTDEEEDTLEVLVQKAKNPADLTDEDNRRIWALFHMAVSAGMKAAPNEQ